MKTLQERIAVLTTATKRHPRIWIPKPGDYIVGTITEFGFNTVEDCTYRAYIVVKESAEVFHRFSLNRFLNGQLNDLNAAVGDLVSIQFVCTEPRPHGAKVDVYNLIVDKG